jgi:hypothetical protein
MTALPPNSPRRRQPTKKKEMGKDRIVPTASSVLHRCLSWQTCVPFAHARQEIVLCYQPNTKEPKIQIIDYSQKSRKRRGKWNRSKEPRKKKMKKGIQTKILHYLLFKNNIHARKPPFFFFFFF